MPNTGTGSEKIYYPLYDSITLGAADLAATLFQAPVGQASKTLYDTNMRLAGMLQQPQTYDLLAFWIAALPGATAVNLIALSKGTLILWCGSKPYHEVPLFMLTSGSGLSVQVAQSNAAVAAPIIANFGEPDARNLYSLEYPVQIKEGEHFRAELTWPVAPGALKIYVGFEGTMGRAIQ
jgi:hypothetical protein